MTLSEYIKENGTDSIGSRAASFDMFPILIKLIDAHDSLSIQVHPDDEYALRVEGEYGKTEMWYIVDCKPNSYLYYGLNRTVSKEEFRQRIENNTILEILQKVPVHKGDVFFIPAGTIHAICSGILICEIQQNSNTTSAELETLPDSFMSLMILSGSGTLELGASALDLKKGDSIFIPAQKGKMTLKGEFEAILSHV